MATERTDTSGTIVVAGNGPSLKDTPLKELSALYPVIAVNRVHLLYPETPWRPDHWVLLDRSGATQWETDVPIHVGQGYTCWVREDMCAWRSYYTAPNLRIVRECGHIDVERNPATAWHLDDAEKPICKMGGSMYGAVQIAIHHLGARRILTVGCDMGYQPNRVNHFAPDYVDPDYLGPERARLVVANLEHAWRVSLRECRKRGIELLNAGIDSQLSVLPRLSLSDALT